MSDLTLHTVVRSQVALRSARQALAAGARRAGQRLTREQTGQDVLEYTGLIVFVAAAVALMFGLDIPQKIVEAMASAMNSVFSQGSTHYSAPSVTVPSGG
jgi:hypothetical protein